MTISVTPNGDGTITVACGGESITVGSPSGSGAGAPKPDPGDPPILWPNGGATANIVATGRAKTKVVRVPSTEALVEAIRREHDAHAHARKPTIFQFHVKGGTPLDIGAINKALSDLGNPEWLGAQFKLRGPADD